MSSPSKVRFDGLDVQAMVAYVQGALAGRRVVNIYDGATGESYIFKLEGDKSSKEFLLLESGIRFHTLSNFQADAMPTPFCAKLRKHLRGLRLELVSQIGRDRVVLFQFGAGSSKHSVILELYAKGNLILTDMDYTILALLRSHVYNNDDSTAVAVQVGQVYPVSYATNLSVEGNPTLSSTSDATEPAPSTQLAVSMESGPEFNAWVLQHIDAAAAAAASNKKKKKQAGITLKTLLSQNHDSGVSHYGPALIEHCIRTADLDPNVNLAHIVVNDVRTVWNADEWNRLRDALQNEGPRILQRLATQNSSTAGYILYRPREASTGDDAVKEVTANPDALPHAGKILQEFQPILLKQHISSLHIAYETFTAAVEDYFDHLANQKLVLKAVSAENAAIARLEKVRTDQQERIDALGVQQELLERQAATVQLHANSVDKALAVINSALDSGMGWDQLEQVVAVEQQQNANPIALLIHKLELEQDSMILRLPSIESDFSSEDGGVVTLDVKVSLKETAYANANRLFAQYRGSKVKSLKTIDASTVALKAAEETARRQLSEAQKRAKQSGATVPGGKRKPAWFEKFHWFITTDNYLVVGGRDAHQNELLVKRYMRPGDAYLHADVHGAASCILRAKRRRRTNGSGTDIVPLSEQALRQAGNFTICWSSAWTSRMVTSAWWVEKHQVTKTAPSGEYLTVGSFMIRGKKTFLPPTPLEMGLAVLFRLGDDDSVLRHKIDRRDFALLEEAGGSDDSFSPLNEREDFTKYQSEEVHIVEDYVTDVDKQVFEANDDRCHVDDEESADRDGEAMEPSSVGEVPDTDFDESDDEAYKADIVAELSDAQPRKSGLSVRDRKLIKKYGSLQAAKEAAGTRTGQNEDCREQIVEASATASAVSNGQVTLKRGQKAKLKRAGRKYADQDDEDRHLAMLLLHGDENDKTKKSGRLRTQGKVSVTDTQKVVAAETVALLVKDASAVAGKLSDDVRSILAECVTVLTVDENTGSSPTIRWDKFDADTLDQVVALTPVEAQVAVAMRLLNLKQTTRVDNFSASLGGTRLSERKCCAVFLRWTYSK